MNAGPGPAEDRPGVVPGGLERAWGGAVTRGVMRSAPGDFIVQEDLGFCPDGGNGHTLLYVRKTAANSEWAARRIARAAGVRPRDVGYCGMKDRHALTTQWFSVPGRPRIDSQALSEDDLEILEQAGHSRKLRRGSHRGNHFHIVLRQADGLEADIGRRMSAISTGGVPNYFGAQRFGRQGGNLELARALAEGARLDRRRRGFALSAARSAIFNEVLSRRVAMGAWNALLSGDIAMLDGSASWFKTEESDRELRDRLRAMDIHPSGPLWGIGDPPSSAETLRLELEVARSLPELLGCVEAAGMRQERRALRLPVRDLRWSIDDRVLQMSFRLPRGAFATAVVAEILEH